MKNQINLQTGAKVVIESGEELLYQRYAPRVIKDRVENLVVGLDGGSTQTRVSFMRKPDEIGSLEYTYVIPSAVSEVQHTAEIKAKGPELYHRMESVIMNEALAPFNVFDKVRVVRGTKLIDLGQAVSRINSSVQKVNTRAFYINIIDSIAYGIIMDCAARRMPLADTYKVSLTCSLPPDDVKGDKNKETFLKYIKNSFKWNSLELGVEINISVEDCYVTTEPEASVKCNYALSGEEIPYLVLAIDGGGRSIGTEILRQGLTFPQGSEAFPYGGTQLADEVANKFFNANGGSKPNETIIKESLVTGFLRKGRSSTDIVEEITEAKRELAQRLFADIVTNVFDSQTVVTIEDIEAVIFSGRLFEEGEYGVSIAHFLAEQIKERNPDCEIIYNTDTYMIPIGNAIIAFMEFGKVLDENPQDIPYLPVDDEELEIAATEE